MRRWLTALLAMLIPAAASAAPLVAPTDALSPAEERAKFHLPPGFDAQLVAAEPDIQKPMNLNFDARGRLWVSHTVEYPFPVKEGQPSRDGVSILSDFGPDGRARKLTRFADNLNIPIGVLPLGDGHEAIVWSIPYIWKLTDTDDDGVADKREILYGPFAFDDTHGNQSSFARGLDGWIYATHGFRNDSKIKLRGEGDVVLELQSGNTYRFKPDGSAIEQVSHGQVNPFGLCFDALGNMFTADCHSRPVMMILRGAYYQSFGKPHDGLGFAPETTTNDHGSTGIAGIIAYDADHLPEEYRGNLFVGNVVTSRIHRDVVEWRGSSPWVASPQDFLVSDDAWFRPVNIQLGPDGAIYVADFYNRIIGHYEVDLHHPGRDRERGRIWRIVYTGELGHAQPLKPIPDLTKLSMPQLLETWQRDNLTLRTLATHQMVDRFGKRAADAITQHINDGQEAINWTFAPWVLLRTGQLDEEWIDDLLGEQNATLDVQTLHALAERPRWSAQTAELVRERIMHGTFVARAGADALARHPDAANIAPLLSLWAQTPAEDTQLIHTIRMALREQLRAAADAKQLAAIELDAESLRRMADIALAVPTETAAWFLFDYARTHNLSAAELRPVLTHVTRHVSLERVNEVAKFVHDKFDGDIDAQLVMFEAIYAGLSQRGVRLTPGSEMAKWAETLAAAVLDPKRDHSPMWSSHNVEGMPAAKSPWGVRHRNSTDNDPNAVYFDSIVSGEQLTGVLRSRPIAIPNQLSFWMCGHNGFPNTNPPPANHIRLKLVDTGEVIAREVPPRNDIARKYTWDLSKWAGKQGVIEIVDANTLNAYAWIGVGRFEPAVVHVPAEGFDDGSPGSATVIRLLGELGARDLTDKLVLRLRDSGAPFAERIASAQAMFALSRKDAAPVLMPLLATVSEPAPLRIEIAQLLTQVGDAPDVAQAIAGAFSGASASGQRDLAMAIAASPVGAQATLAAVAKGQASPRLCQDPAIVERLRASRTPDLDARIAKLTEGIPPADQRVPQLISQRIATFAAAAPSPQRGKEVFAKNCAACHRIGDVGAMIGPQLDGIGARGVERLLEDVLDPNRNVDQAFRTTIIETKDGDRIVGLFRREEGQTTVIADAQGKERVIRTGDIAERQVVNLSPMPSNFGDAIKESDLYDLMSLLLQQRVDAK